MSSIWGMILQWGSTMKVSIELPVATRHRRDMTDKLLKAMLNPNKQQHLSSLQRNTDDLMQFIVSVFSSVDSFE